jgi:hypothetical protein
LLKHKHEVAMPAIDVVGPRKYVRKNETFDWLLLVDKGI